MNPRDWMKEENPEYLPPFLRDFHDAKDFFKTLETYFEPAQGLEAHTWISNQIFTVDVFLWFCGIHGYTLQKSRKKGVEFEDISTTLKAGRDQRHQSFARMMTTLTTPTAPQGTKGADHG